VTIEWALHQRVDEPALLVSLMASAAALVLAIPLTRVAWILAVLATSVAAVLSSSSLVLGIVASASDASTLAPQASAFLLAVLCMTLALTTLASGARLSPVGEKTGSYALCLALCVGAGWCSALQTEELLGLFASVEVAWLATTALVALGESRIGAKSGAWRLLVAGGVSAALFLCGIALLGAVAGSFRLADILTVQVQAPSVAAMGGGLVIVAFAIKAGMAPFSYWIVGAWGRANAFALLSISTVNAFGALAALVHFVGLAIQMPAIGGGISVAIAGLGSLAVVVGSLQAIGARDVRRLLVYIWSSHAGVALLCVSVGSPSGLSAAFVQMAAMAAAALAIAVGVVLALGEESNLSAFEGLARRAPFASAAITSAMLSVMGAPLTLGFLGRWRLVEVGIGAGWWWVTGAVFITSLAGVFYGGRLIELMYLKRKENAAAVSSGAWRWTAAPALVVAIATIAAGLAPEGLLRAADMTAAHAFGILP
jgi:NADH:ubiquinone oxidoreductase subunit 2 (subunit N)